MLYLIILLLLIILMDIFVVYHTSENESVDDM